MVRILSPQQALNPQMGFSLQSPTHGEAFLIEVLKKITCPLFFTLAKHISKISKTIQYLCDGGVVIQ